MGNEEFQRPFEKCFGRILLNFENFLINMTLSKDCKQIRSFARFMSQGIHLSNKYLFILTFNLTMTLKLVIESFKMTKSY